MNLSFSKFKAIMSNAPDNTLVAIYFCLVRFSFPEDYTKALLLLKSQFQGMIKLDYGGH